MQTTKVPPVFHSVQCATYHQNDLPCIGSDLLLLLLMFFFVLYCGDTLDKSMSTPFSAITTWCFVWGIRSWFCIRMLDHPQEKAETVLWKYSLKKMSWKFISIAQLISIFHLFFYLKCLFPKNTSSAALNKRKHNCNKKIIIYDRCVLFLIRNVEVIGFRNTLNLRTFVFTVFDQIID